MGLCKNLVKNLVNNGTIKAADSELYLYGLEQGLFMLSNLCTTIIIGFILNRVWESIIFTIAYLPLRSNAGGYHARTPLNCYVISTLMITCALFLVRFVIQKPNIFIGMLVIGFLITFILAPVEDENKLLAQIEVRVYKKRTRSILFILLIIFSTSLALRLNNISATIATTIIFMGAMIVAGKVKNFLNQEEKMYE